MTAAAFFPALQAGFVNWDDGKNFLDNPHYRGLARDNLSWMFTTFHMGHYQPLSWLTLGFDYSLWGMNPFGYHLTNLLLHMANAVLFYFLCCRLLTISCSYEQKDKFEIEIAAAFGALLFALHPLRVESVAWVTERRDVLAGFFLLSSVILYSRATVHDYSRNLALSASAFILSLLAKASGMSLVAVLIILDVYPRRRLGPMGQWFDPAKRKIWLEKVIFLFSGIIAAVVALAAQRHSEAFRPFEQHDWSSRAVQLFYSLTFYLHKTLVPVDLSPLYELPLNPAEWYPTYIVSAVLVVALTAGFFLARNRFPALLAGWLIYVVLLLPTSGIAQSGPQLVADRYSYFACMSWAVLVGAGFLTAQRRLREKFLQRQYVLLAGLIIIGFLGTLTWRQTLIWRDSISLWRHALNIDPQSPYAHTNLGVAFGALGRFEDAAKEFTEAQRLNPTDADNYYNLGNILARQGHSAAAILQFESALRIRPRHADAHYELATLLAKNRDYARAISHFRSAIDARPSDARAHYNLAQVYATQAQWPSAAEHFRLALQYDPAHLRARMQLGKALSEMGDPAAAIAEFHKVLDREPTSAEAHEALARLYAKQGNKQQALQHYQETIKLLEKRQRSGH